MDWPVATMRPTKRERPASEPESGPQPFVLLAFEELMI